MIWLGRMVLRLVIRLAKRNVVLGRLLMVGSALGWLARRRGHQVARVRLAPEETMTVTVEGRKGHAG